MLAKKVQLFFEFMHRWEDDAKIRDKKDIKISYEGEELAVKNLKMDIVRYVNEKLQNGNSVMLGGWNNHIVNPLSYHYSSNGYVSERFDSSSDSIIKQIDFSMEEAHKKILEDCINIVMQPPGFIFVSDDDRKRSDFYLRRMIIPLYFRWIHAENINDHNIIIRKFCTVMEPNSNAFLINQYSRYGDVNMQVFKVLNDPSHVTKVVEMLQSITEEYKSLDALSQTVLNSVSPLNKSDGGEQTKSQTKPTEKELNKLTVVALKEMATEKKLKIPKSAKKADLIDLLINGAETKTTSDSSNDNVKEEVDAQDVEDDVKEKKIKVVKKKTTSETQKTDVYKKKAVPKALKLKLWKESFGDTLTGSCYVCKRELQIDNFEAGHIVAEVNGGETILSNLKVVCKQCNTSCGTKNLEEFKDAMLK
ncbi:hypothetical protein YASMINEVIRUS_599 [Yasminevirus sp. GU-2018]|uniref:HNH endonuclease 5 domain-containing protein n=1 Tax=Yasminevirus sp. GU-2018 TaxID=2420051 RepID=A0A5K0UAL6_9VIRU|nr:hypothetical protein YASMINEVIRUS_599 [Yasminevirus sp. GU-2018]